MAGFTLEQWLVAGVGLVYAVIGLVSMYKGNTWYGLTFLGYAVSNIGLFKLG